jgi:hypothetical protein
MLALDHRVAAAFPVLRTVEWSSPREGDGFVFNVAGARARQNYFPRHWFDEVSRITLNEEMFEWVDIVETVLASSGSYVIVYLGTGYGRWLVNAGLLARRFSRMPFLVGVEAEDTHFSWLKQHLSDNEISSAEQRLFHAPIGGGRQDVPFTLGHAEEWYGQSVLPSTDYGFGNWPNARVELRRSITLEDAIGDLSAVDLLDLDIQGMEREVVSSSIEFITGHVRRLHIGTHSREIEKNLRTLMTEAGWKSRFDYGCATPNQQTPAGMVDFQDGVQSWINPHLQI